MTLDLESLARDPAAFRSALQIDTDRGPQPFDDVCEPWQRRDFLALDPAWRAVAGLVERVPCEEDRRGTYVSLTPAGARVLGQAAPVHLQGIERHFARHLSDDDARHLNEVMARVIAGVERER